MVDIFKVKLDCIGEDQIIDVQNSYYTLSNIDDIIKCFKPEDRLYYTRYINNHLNLEAGHKETKKEEKRRLKKEEKRHKKFDKNNLKK